MTARRREDARLRRAPRGGARGRGRGRGRRLHAAGAGRRRRDGRRARAGARPRRADDRGAAAVAGGEVPAGDHLRQRRPGAGRQLRRPERGHGARRCCCWASWWRRRAGAPRSSGPPRWWSAFVAYAGILVLSSIQAPGPADVWDTAQELLIGLAIVLVVSATASREDGLRHSCELLVAAAAALVGLTILKQLGVGGTWFGFATDNPLAAEQQAAPGAGRLRVRARGPRHRPPGRRQLLGPVAGARAAARALVDPPGADPAHALVRRGRGGAHRRRRRVHPVARRRDRAAPRRRRLAVAAGPPLSPRDRRAADPDRAVGHPDRLHRALRAAAQRQRRHPVRRRSAGA